LSFQRLCFVVGRGCTPSFLASFVLNIILWQLFLLAWDYHGLIASDMDFDMLCISNIDSRKKARTYQTLKGG